ncbi:MAG: flagellar hook-length control protein [Proteobacteria bacterium]|nr:flagellar hook-length control protein [Pseudomonadota bacterium]
MSITVVSTPPTPTQPSAADGGSDATAASQDFANLLHGQLTAKAAQPIVATEVAGDLPITDAVPADAVAADATLADAASLLAALGLATTPTDAKPADAKPADTAPADTTPSDAAPADAAASVLAALGLASTPAIAPAPAQTESEQPAAESLTSISGTASKSLKADGQTESLKTEPAPLTSTALDDDKAAKFAATLATAEQTVGAKTDSPDLTANNISAQPNVPGNAATHPTAHNSSLPVHTPVRDQNWAADFGQKIVWLASNDKQSAQLTLNPPQMGPIEVSLNVDKGNASVSFASANAEVRDALETALPKLREMFASAGIELGQTNVGAQSFSQQQAGNGERNQSSSRWMSDNAILATESTGALQTAAFATRQGNGMVDIFA